ncbi:MAG: NADH:flavin oxidoreductase [Bacteroidales bacterium]|jgi:2,4-dienoyl-CoA reductase-like NADH-dependent reductase (Old Yellow Enzyme family)|nr:NADH:flavin oxidoreductase [Bacteroidales bacterium]
MQKAFTPVRLRDLTLRNRFIKTATNEGMWEDGLPSQRLVDHHARLAQGGIGLTTVAYGAINADGRTMAQQMYMRPEVVPGLKRLTDAVHSHGAAASIQLTHCGFFTNNRLVTDRRPLGPSALINNYGLLSGIFMSREMTIADCQLLAADFARSARLALDAGFDAIELHLGHGYLLSQFLSPLTNKRRDEYGGSLENRMRFPLEVVDAVRKEAGAGVPLICKINLDDGFKGGQTIAESVMLSQALERAGVDLLVLSGGFTSKTPFYLMRGDVPLWRMIRAERQWQQKGAFAIFGKFIIRKYKFEENFFLPLARQIRQAVKMPLAYLGGVVSAKGVEQIMQEGFDLVAVGRALIHDPDFILGVARDPGHVSGCTHCNICVAEMDRGGIRCVI